MLLGVYIGQYCINTLTYFFLTWFPVYLVKERGMTILKAGFVAALPAVAGFLGGVLGGVHLGPPDQAPATRCRWRARRRSSAACCWRAHDRLQLRRSRLAGGRRDGAGLLRQGHRRAGLGGGGRHLAEGSRRPERRPVQHLRQHRRHHHADRHRLHLSGTGSFAGALVFVGANAAGAVLCYLLLVGEIKRFEFKTPVRRAGPSATAAPPMR